MQGGKYFHTQTGDVIDVHTDAGNERFNQLSSEGGTLVRISDEVAKKIKPERKRPARKRKPAKKSTAKK